MYDMGVKYGVIEKTRCRFQKKRSMEREICGVQLKDRKSDELYDDVVFE